jgi:hypothetical protein
MAADEPEEEFVIWGKSWFSLTDIQKVLHPVDFAFDLSLTANHDALGHRGSSAMNRLN